MSRARQFSFLPKLKLDHGGTTRIGRRKVARPFDRKRPLHIVLKSSRAKGDWSMLRPRNKIKVLALLEQQSQKHSVHILRFANVGNHLHLLITTRSRTLLQSFLREFSGTLASKITGGTKGQPRGKFWDELVYSRIVSWGRELARLHIYLTKNLLEGLGIANRATINQLFRFARPIGSVGRI